MESKDIAHFPLYAPTSRPKLGSLRIDQLESALHLEEPSPSSAATTTSPITPLVPRPPSSGSETAEERDPASGPKRSTSETNAKGDKEKRKRSRVTPEQLVHLERFFAEDRSPTAARRREISDLLGMQERQTQIWFQNRRAKAKLLESKPNTPKGRTETPPDSPPVLSSGFEVDLNQLIHEDGPVTIIPCTDLSVGTWRRIATTVGKHDLVAYVCQVKRCLTWFIQSGGHGFKMEIPFSTIVETQFKNGNPGSGVATFVLSQAPLFYLEQASSHPDGSQVRYWKRCTDWTEGFQATNVLRHELTGSAVQLAHVVRALQSGAIDSEIALHPPSYHTESPPTMELPIAPPMAALGANFQHIQESSPPEISRKRFSEPGISEQGISEQWTTINRGPPHSAPAGSFPDTVHRGMAATAEHGYGEYEHQMATNNHSQLNEYSVPISQSLASRPSYPRTFSDTQYEATRRPYSSHFTYETSAPPLLTTPYHPPPHIAEGLSDHTEQLNNGSLISGLPGLAYNGQM